MIRLEISASFDIFLGAAGNSFKLPRHAQIELKKDLPTGLTFYETYILEFARISNAKERSPFMNSGASFRLDEPTRAELKRFAVIVNDAEPW